MACGMLALLSLPRFLSLFGCAEDREEWSLIKCIVYTYVIILTFLGPEYLGRRFGVAYDHDMTDAAGREAMAAAHVADLSGDRDSSDDGHVVEKTGARTIEKV